MNSPLRKFTLSIDWEDFGQLVVSPEAKQLINIFFAMTDKKKNPYDEKLIKPVKDIAMLGAGFMGAGIATVCADKGIRSWFSDPSKEALGRALNHAGSFFKKRVERSHH